jgi:transcriptional regulator GlxA family with amidase domain
VPAGPQIVQRLEHHHSHKLEGDSLGSAPWQVRRAEEYIRANWDKPVTIEALAAAANTSVRSLFHSFRQARWHSRAGFG